jgi:hypothetical protein
MTQRLSTRVDKATQRLERLKAGPPPPHPILAAWVRGLTDAQLDAIEEAINMLDPIKPKGEPKP